MWKAAWAWEFPWQHQHLVRPRLHPLTDKRFPAAQGLRAAHSQVAGSSCMYALPSWASSPASRLDNPMSAGKAPHKLKAPHKESLDQPPQARPGGTGAGLTLCTLCTRKVEKQSEPIKLSVINCLIPSPSAPPLFTCSPSSPPARCRTDSPASTARGILLYPGCLACVGSSHSLAGSVRAVGGQERDSLGRSLVGPRPLQHTMHGT